MNRLILSVTALAATVLAVPNANAVGRMLDVRVIERHSGRVLPVHYHRGEYWVAGTPGAAYSVRVRNQTGERLLAVMSVDGVNVLSGETASVGQSGYVFDAWRQSDISGWRKNTSEIAAFEFTASPHSYAERTGRPFDVGVIGVALFRERAQYAPQPLPYPQPWPHGRGRSYDDHDGQAERYGKSERDAAPASPQAAPQAQSRSSNKESYSGAPQARVEPKLGTGHGAREYAPTTHTTFERAQNSPNEIIRIRYDSHQNLMAMGVIRPHTRYEGRPNPFPESRQHYGYVPDPPPYWR